MDGAHNVDAIKQLAKTIKLSFNHYKLKKMNSYGSVESVLNPKSWTNRKC